MEWWARCDAKTAKCHRQITGVGTGSKPPYQTYIVNHRTKRVACTAEYCCWWTGHFSYYVNRLPCSVHGRFSFPQYPLTWTLGGLQSRSGPFGEKSLSGIEPGFLCHSAHCLVAGLTKPFCLLSVKMFLNKDKKRKVLKTRHFPLCLFLFPIGGKSSVGVNVKINCMQSSGAWVRVAA